jgi:hypothetical protein
MEPRFVAGLISFARVVSCARQTTNLIINLDHDEWIIDDDTKPLADLGFGESHNLPRSIDRSIPMLSTRKRDGIKPVQP